MAYNITGSFQSHWNAVSWGRALTNDYTPKGGIGTTVSKAEAAGRS